MQAAPENFPSPYPQGRWLPPDTAAGGGPPDVVKAPSETAVDPYARGDWLSQARAKKPPASPDVATDGLEKPPEKDLVLRGPFWNYNRVPHTTDAEHYDYLLYRKVRSTLFAQEDFILKGEPWRPVRPIKRSFVECFFRFLKRHGPEATALLEAETGRTLTFSEIIEKAESLSAGLRWIGLMPGQTVAIVSYNSAEALAVLAATLAAAGVPAPVDSGLGPAELGAMLRTLRPRLVFTEGGKTLAKVEMALGYLMTQRPPQLIVNTRRTTRHWTVPRLLREPEPLPPGARGRDPERPVLLMFTSGVTGTAKVALIPERYFTDSKAFIESAFTTKTPLSSYTALMTGPLFWTSHRVVFFRGLPTVPVIVESFRKYAVFVWFTDPSNLLHLLHWPVRPRIPVLKMIFVSGAAFPLATYQEVHDKVFQEKVQIYLMYGMTEGGLFAANTPPANKPGSIGRLFHNVQLKVVDKESGLPLGPNEEGLMCFKSPTTMLGYLDNPEATAEAFDPQGFLLSGDLGYYDRDGWVYFVERQKDLIKWQNYHVPPSEVEAHLLALPAVKEAAVVGIPDKMDGELVAAAVVLNKGFEVAPFYLEHLANGRISENKRIRGGVHIFSELLKTDAGKPHKAAVRQMIMARISEQADASESISRSTEP